ncbi:MAG: 4-hydroxy-tetrahydrodipicolinate synthase, partial [Dethiobacteria bacterium]
MKNPFGSLLTAMVTPFKENMEINYSRAVELAEYLLANDSDGLVVTGTTGESPTLSIEEKIELYRILSDKFGKEVIIAGTGGNNTKEVVQLTREAERCGVGGIMLVTPYYNKPPQEGLYHHFKAVAESVALPIILYNVPGRTGVNLDVETVLRLAQIDNIVALKDASGNTDQASCIIEKAPTEFTVYCGDDSLIIPFLRVGSSGVISVASHLVGPRIKEIIGKFHHDPDKAVRIHECLLPLFKGLFMTTNPIVIKEA